MAKRAPPTATASAGGKKSKPVIASKPGGKGKAKSSAPRPSVAHNIADTIHSAAVAAQHTAADIAHTVSEAVDVAGDLLLDVEDGKTPVSAVSVNSAAEEMLDVPKLKKKGAAAAKAAKGKAEGVARSAEGKAAGTAKEAQQKLEDVVEAHTGVDVKSAKGKATKAVQSAQKKARDVTAIVQPQVEKVASAVRPAIETAVIEVQDAATNPRKRKKAEDFMAAAEETVKKVVGDVAGKVGEMLEGALKNFGEASGLAADLAGDAEKGKKAVRRAKKAEDAEEPSKKKAKQAGEASSAITVEVGRQAKQQAVEGGKKAAATASKLVEEKKEPVKPTVAKGKKAAEDKVAETKKFAEKKGASAKKVAEEQVDDLIKLVDRKTAGSKKAAVTKGVDVKETGNRKARAAVDVADETTVPAQQKAKGVVVAAKSRASDAAEAIQPIAAKGKKAAKAASDTLQVTTKKVAKGSKAAMDATVEVSQDEEADEDEDMEEGDDDEESLIHGFSSSDGGADSSDDESDAEDLAIRAAGKKIDMSTLPMVAKDDKSVQAKLKRAKKQKDDQKGTLYLGRIPHGFYEEQIKEYFSQFGDVTRLRLARNRKTGASKHYGYIELSSQSVAQIVAETMNNYLLMGHLLKCEVIPADEVHPELWVGANKKFRKIPRARVEKMKHDKPRTQEKQDEANSRLLERQEARRNKIKNAGIDYSFEGHK